MQKVSLQKYDINCNTVTGVRDQTEYSTSNTPLARCAPKYSDCFGPEYRRDPSLVCQNICMSAHYWCGGKEPQECQETSRASILMYSGLFKTGYGPRQPAQLTLLWARGLHSTIAQGPFQLFYNSMKYALAEVLSHRKISAFFIWDLKNPLLQLCKRKVFPIRV